MFWMVLKVTSKVDGQTITIFLLKASLKRVLSFSIAAKNADSIGMNIRTKSGAWRSEMLSYCLCLVL